MIGPGTAMAPIAGVAIVRRHDVAARGKTTKNSVPLALELVEIVAPSCLVKALTSRMPRPLDLAISKLGGKPIPRSRTDTVIFPASRANLTHISHPV